MADHLSLHRPFPFTVPAAGARPASAHAGPSGASDPYTVFALRRCVLTAGARARSAERFDTWCAQDVQQGGGCAFGHFTERGQAGRFTSLRAYRDMAQPRTFDAALDGAPPGQENGEALADPVDSEQRMLLRPLHPGSGPALLPDVDPLHEPHGARGLVVAQILKAAPGRLAACAALAEQWFVHYQGRGVIEAGILATLQADSFPAHAVRSDGEHIVWLGVLSGDAAFAALAPVFDAAAAALCKAGVLAAPPELLLLEPARRSRLRWMQATTGIATPAVRPLSPHGDRAPAGARPLTHTVADSGADAGEHA